MSKPYIITIQDIPKLLLNMKYVASHVDAMDLVEDFLELGKDVPYLTIWSTSKIICCDSLEGLSNEFLTYNQGKCYNTGCHAGSCLQTISPTIAIESWW